jgi:hypothetical protein
MLAAAGVWSVEAASSTARIQGRALGVMQGAGEQEQMDMLKQHLTRCKAVAAILFPRFEGTSFHVLWVLYGWLEPWISPAAAAPSAPCANSSIQHGSCAMELIGSENNDGKNNQNCMNPMHDWPGGAAGPEQLMSTASGIPAQRGHAEIDTGTAREVLQLGGSSERWRSFVTMLHDVVAASGTGHAQMFQEQLEEHCSEIDMLRESLNAHKV